MMVRVKLVIMWGVIFILLSACWLVIAAQEKGKKMPEPKLIPLDLGAKEYKRILGGPPETVTMHSGLVVLEPGKSVGKHNTKNYEEVLIVLEGSGKMVITGGPSLDLGAMTIAYCPPRTEHNVTCIGKAKLKYVYVVAHAE